MVNIKKWLVYKELREVRNFLVAILKAVGNYVSRVGLVAEEHYYDNKLGGVETNEHCIAGRNLGLFKDGKQYMPTPYNALKKIAGHLNLNEDDIFIDFGSGKGRVICFFAAQRVKKIIGIELDPVVAELSRANIRKLKSNTAPIEVINADAASIKSEGGTVFFMFNPFGGETLAHVLNNMREELTNSPRKIRIVYYSPAYCNIVDAQNWLTREGEICGGNVLIWRNRLHIEKS